MSECKNTIPYDSEGKIHGTCILCKDNKISEKINYIHGKQNGEHIKYYPNGKIRFKVYCKDNLIWNIEEYNDSNGNPFDYGTFRNGTGKIITYHTNDTKYLEGNVVDGYFVGVKTIYGAGGGYILIDEDEYLIKSSFGLH